MTLPSGTKFVGIISSHLFDDVTSGNVKFRVYWVSNQDVGGGRPNDADADVSLPIGALTTEATIQSELKTEVRQHIADVLEEPLVSIVLLGCAP